MHPNDTLNGKLIAWELPEERHLRNRFGYWHNVEERMVEVCLAIEGITRETDRFFYNRVSQALMRNHRDDPKPWHQDRRGLSRWGGVRQQAAYEREAAIRHAELAAIIALRKIATGHNDPMNLALEVLAALDALKQERAA